MSTDNEKIDDNKTHKELLMLYKIATDDIKFSKLQMSRTFYYTILAIAALISIYVASSEIRSFGFIDIEIHIFSILSPLIAIAAIILLIAQYLAQDSYRNTTEAITSKLTLEVINLKKEVKEKHTLSFFWRNIIFLLVNVLVIIFACYLSLIVFCNI